MWLTTALQIIWFSQVARAAISKFAKLRYVDFSIEDQDLYFDRIVLLSLNVNCTYENYGVGVHIYPDRILTSFNPFRNIIRDETKFSELYAITLMGRIRSGSWGYITERSKLACGRQIQDLPDHVITKGDLWHGTGNRHCPLHDLLVFRIQNYLEESTLGTEQHTMALYPENEFTSRKNGVFLTKLAKPHERIGFNFKFCAVVDNILKVTYYTEDDKALLDCDEWLPRDWGYFLCILNKNNYTEMLSGAMLVSNERLFGVASFLLSKGTESIIVFTDIRPYYDLIQNTCTYSDSEETRPDEFPPVGDCAHI